jgi:predicted alpha/beta hydrolase family esterase
MIGSTNDPWMNSSHAEYWANKCGSEFIDAGALGHINADSGLGDWRFGLYQLERLLLASTTPNFPGNRT